MKEGFKTEELKPESFFVFGPTKALKGLVSLPSSKSISNRALIIQYLAKKPFLIESLSQANDTHILSRLLKIIKQNLNSTKALTIDCEDAGTAYRFLTALLAISPGNWYLTGSKRMQERPIGILVDGLNSVGADIKYLKKKGYPPLQINGSTLTGRKIKIDGSVSSQFITALLLISPDLKNGLEIEILNKLSSAPYVNMTLKLLSHFGIGFHHNKNCIQITHQHYQPKNLSIEPDWTSASYWYEIVAFAEEADITMRGLKKQSIQGDSEAINIYQSLGVKTEFLDTGIKLTKTASKTSYFKYDFTNCPDLAQSVIVTCAGLGIPGVFTGIESLRIKETDRLEALSSQLKKIGIKCEIVSNSRFQIYSSGDPLSKTKSQKPKIINTFNDHRMALAFAPLALISGIIQIENPAVVSKSYPEYWHELGMLGFQTTLPE